MKYFFAVVEPPPPPASSRAHGAVVVLFDVLHPFSGTDEEGATALDPELLQLVELAPGALCENSIADVLYSQWLVLPETTKLVSLQRALSPPRLLLWFVIKFPRTLKHFVSRSLVTLHSASSTWSALTVCRVIYGLLA